MIKGVLKNWLKLKVLALRTELAHGKTESGVKFSVSLNVDNRALFVEFPEGWKVTYQTEDIVRDAFELYEKRRD